MVASKSWRSHLKAAANTLSFTSSLEAHSLPGGPPPLLHAQPLPLPPGGRSPRCVLRVRSLPHSGLFRESPCRPCPAVDAESAVPTILCHCVTHESPRNHPHAWLTREGTKAPELGKGPPTTGRILAPWASAQASLGLSLPDPLGFFPQLRASNPGFSALKL